MKFNDIFESFEKIPEKDFSELKEKHEARKELEEYAIRILEIQHKIPAKKHEYDEAVRKELYDEAEELRNKHNNIIDLLNALKDEFKTAIVKYEKKYGEDVYVTAERGTEHYCSFHKKENDCDIIWK